MGRIPNGTIHRGASCRTTAASSELSLTPFWALQIGDDRAAADAALKTLIDTQADVSAYQIAEVYALREDADAMFAWLDRAWANRDPGINALLFDPFILRYRDDPRFAAYCRKVGLPVPANPNGTT